MKNLWFLFDLTISIILGFFMNLYITSEIIVYFFSGNQLMYLIIFIICLIIQMAIIFSIIRLIRNKNIDRFTYRCLIMLYGSIMLVLLFGRQVMNSSINLNPIDLINFTNKDIIYQNILNILFFLPIGYLIKNLAPNKAFTFSLIGIIGIELLQLITKRGMFDINDIILNLLGIFTCYYFTRKYNIDLVEKNTIHQ